jgi:hypothetical protein
LYCRLDVILFLLATRERNCDWLRGKLSNAEQAMILNFYSTDFKNPTDILFSNHKAQFLNL